MATTPLSFDVLTQPSFLKNMFLQLQVQQQKLYINAWSIIATWLYISKHSEAANNKYVDKEQIH